MTPERKAMMMDKLKKGKEAKAKARAEAAAAGLPDPHPRKKRVSKKARAATDGALKDPLSEPSTNDTVRGIDQATKEGTAKKPVDATPVETKPIDVPGLPGDAEKAAKNDDIVKSTLKKKVPKEKKGLTTTGKPAKVNETEMITNEETGHQVISAMFPGQEASVKKALKANKKTVTTAAGVPVQEHPNAISDSKTVKNVAKHIPDIKSVEAVGKPFSFATIRKVLYQ
jgi:hypothetical protein